MPSGKIKRLLYALRQLRKILRMQALRGSRTAILIYRVWMRYWSTYAVAMPHFGLTER